MISTVFLMCAPTAAPDSPEGATAPSQWAELKHRLEVVGKVITVPGGATRHAARLALVADGRAVLANSPETVPHAALAAVREQLQSIGYVIHEPRDGVRFCGAADAVVDEVTGHIWLGYGHGSTLEAGEFLAAALEAEVVALRLVDERFPTLDMALCHAGRGKWLYIPDAFDERSRRELERRISPENRYAVSLHDAAHAVCQSLSLEGAFLTHHTSREVESVLGEWGIPVERVRWSTDAAGRRGPGACVLSLSRTVHPIPAGGYLDSLDGVPRFETRKAARLETVDQDGVAPEGFYGTTIFGTEVWLADGSCVRLAKQRMDGVAVIDEAARTGVVKLIRDLRRGDRVVVGSEGVSVLLERKSSETGEGGESFAFMSSAVSSERRVETAVDRVAWEMWRTRQRGGRIVFVAGPVTVHTGGSPYMEKLAKAGYMSALLGGNAIAVHDIENSLFGTSLGVNLKHGAPVSGGHMHHITAINTIRRHGSIHRAVEAGVLRSGLFHTLVNEGIPFVLAGSIRDDGPLPETIMDLVEAQRQYAAAIEGADIILLLSSMLHSIGVGNMTPAGVRLVCVDINSSVATKLMDRGSLDAIPIVTDVGLFLNLLWRRLEELGGQ